MYQFDWSVLFAADHGRRLIDGTFVTLRLLAGAGIIATLLGFLFGVARWRGGRILRHCSTVYVEFVRNTPPLVQILFWYFSASYVLPASVLAWLQSIGLEFGAAAFALGVYHGAFFAEILRAGLQSVPIGQFEAAMSLGLSFSQALRSVVLPQVLRIVVPPVTSEVVGLTKNTSLAIAIGVTEITYQARYIDVYTFRAIEALTASTILYLGLCLGITALGRSLDARIATRRRTDYALASHLD